MLGVVYSEMFMSLVENIITTGNYNYCSRVNQEVILTLGHL